MQPPRPSHQVCYGEEARRTRAAMNSEGHLKRTLYKALIKNQRQPCQSLYVHVQLGDHDFVTLQEGVR